MRIESAVLDRDEGLWQIGRQVLQRDIGAGHLAALGQHAAVGTDDLDGRRPFRDFERLDRRQMRADIDDHADSGDRAPQAQHHAPINQTTETQATLRAGSALGRAIDRAIGRALARALGLALARRRILVLIVGIVSGLALGCGLGRGLPQSLVEDGGDAVLGGQAQIGDGRGEPEQRLLALAALFPSPRHTDTPVYALIAVR
jgi:hypothetical protein